MSAKKKTEPTALEKLATLRAELEHLKTIRAGYQTEHDAIRADQCPGRPDGLGSTGKGPLTPARAQAALDQARSNLLRGRVTEKDVERLAAERDTAEAAIRDLQERIAAHDRAREAVFADIEALVEAELPAFIAEGERLSEVAHEALAAILAEDAVVKAHAAWQTAAAFWRWLPRSENGREPRRFVPFETGTAPCPLPAAAAIKAASALPEAVALARQAGDVPGADLVFIHGESGSKVSAAAGSKEARNLDASDDWNRI